MYAGIQHVIFLNLLMKITLFPLKKKISVLLSMNWSSVFVVALCFSLNLYFISFLHKSGSPKEEWDNRTYMWLFRSSASYWDTSRLLSVGGSRDQTTLFSPIEAYNHIKKRLDIGKNRWGKGISWQQNGWHCKKGIKGDASQEQIGIGAPNRSSWPTPRGLPR